MTEEGGGVEWQISWYLKIAKKNPNKITTLMVEFEQKVYVYFFSKINDLRQTTSSVFVFQAENAMINLQLSWVPRVRIRVLGNPAANGCKGWDLLRI